LRYVFRFGLSELVLLQSKRTLQNHLDRSAGGIVDFIATTEENLGQSDCAADAASEQCSLASSGERTDDRALGGGSGNGSRIFTFGAVGLHASFFVDDAAIVSSGDIIHRTGNRDCIAAGKDQRGEVEENF